MGPYTDEEYNGPLGKWRVTLTCEDVWHTEDMLDMVLWCAAKLDRVAYHRQQYTTATRKQKDDYTQ